MNEQIALAEPDEKIGSKYHGSPARARARIDHVVSLMAANKWDRGQTAARLAEEWGCNVGTISNYIMAAKYHLDRVGHRHARVEAVKDLIEKWVHDGDEPEPVTNKAGEVIGFRTANDRVRAAELFLKSQGALTEDYLSRPLGERLGDDDKIARLTEIYREPDEITLAALSAAGWIRVDAAMDTTGESEGQ